MRKKLGFEGSVTIDSQGHSGGITLLWRNKDEVQLSSYSKNHVDVIVTIRGWHKFRLTGIYGEPNRARREETWDLLRSLNTMEDIPWVLIGDMNNVLKQTDKRGGNPYPQRLLNGFQGALDDCDLHDVNLEGYQFTWERGHGTSNWIEVRLDRALVSSKFIQCFSEMKLTNLEVSTSNHTPIFFEPVVVIKTNHVKCFRFENAWLREPMCQEIVKETWSRYTEKSLQEKLSRCAEILSDLGKEVTGSFKTRINHHKKIMKAMKGRRDIN